MDKIEALGAVIHQSRGVEIGAGLLGVTVKVPQGGNIAGMLTDARLLEIERRILAIEVMVWPHVS